LKSETAEKSEMGGNGKRSSGKELRNEMRDFGTCESSGGFHVCKMIQT
jgi:hypothetical protein